jgi:hypothetical protein
VAFAKAAEESDPTFMHGDYALVIRKIAACHHLSGKRAILLSEAIHRCSQLLCIIRGFTDRNPTTKPRVASVVNWTL